MMRETDNAFFAFHSNKIVKQEAIIIKYVI